MYERCRLNRAHYRAIFAEPFREEFLCFSYAILLMDTQSAAIEFSSGVDSVVRIMFHVLCRLNYKQPRNYWCKFRWKRSGNNKVASLVLDTTHERSSIRNAAIELGSSEIHVKSTRLVVHLHGGMLPRRPQSPLNKSLFDQVSRGKVLGKEEPGANSGRDDELRQIGSLQ